MLKRYEERGAVKKAAIETVLSYLNVLVDNDLITKQTAGYPFILSLQREMSITELDYFMDNVQHSDPLHLCKVFKEAISASDSADANMQQLLKEEEKVKKREKMSINNKKKVAKKTTTKKKQAKVQPTTPIEKEELQEDGPRVETPKDDKDTHERFDDTHEQFDQKVMKLGGNLSTENSNKAQGTDKVVNELDINQEIRQGFQLLQTRMTAMEQKFETRMTAMEQKFETRMTSLEKKFTGLETKFTGLEKKFTGLETKFTGLEKKITSIYELVSLPRLKDILEEKLGCSVSNPETKYFRKKSHIKGFKAVSNLKGKPYETLRCTIPSETGSHPKLSLNTKSIQINFWIEYGLNKVGIIEGTTSDLLGDSVALKTKLLQLERQIVFVEAELGNPLSFVGFLSNSFSGDEESAINLIHTSILNKDWKTALPGVMRFILSNTFYAIQVGHTPEIP